MRLTIAYFGTLEKEAAEALADNCWMDQQASSGSYTIPLRIPFVT